jgi:hypothetical protein
MRTGPLLVLIALAAAATGADAPIPQDRAAMEKRSRDSLEWNKRSLGDAYLKVGKRDKRWDGPAADALEKAARMFSQQTDPIVAPADVHAPAKRAIEAGCDDPMILYLRARTSVGKDYPGPAEYEKRHLAAGVAMEAGHYSPFRRASAIIRAAEFGCWKEGLTAEQKLKAAKHVDRVLDLLPASAAEEEKNHDWEVGWFNAVDSAISAHRRLSGDLVDAHKRVDAKLAKVAGAEALRLSTEGSILIARAWDARSSAAAFAVTQDQFRVFEDRLREARTALEKAWETKPGIPKVAFNMIVVEKGIGGGDRPAMETWFARAMQVDGNDRNACWEKLEWLDPKWHGGETTDAMLAFAEQCQATKNWSAGLPLIAAEAHFRQYVLLPKPQDSAYLSKPEVWSDISKAYDEFLKSKPIDEAVWRSKYAALCCLAGRYRESEAQFKELGDRLSTWPSAPTYTVEALKKLRTYAAKHRGDEGPGGKQPAK